MAQQVFQQGRVVEDAFALGSERAGDSGGPAGKFGVLFFASSLGGGGAESHLLRVINHLDREKFRVSLALVRPAGDFEAALSFDVKRYYLGRGGRGSATLRMLRAIRPLRQVIRRERPDMVFSVLDLANLANVVAAGALEAPPKIVLGVQTPPHIAYARSRNPVGRLILRLIPRLYPRADQVVALSKGVAGSLIALAPELRERVTVIPNAGVEPEVIARSREALDECDEPGDPLIVACGRLKALKGFSELLDALALVRQTIPAHLWIIGEGEQRPFLERKIERLGLESCARLLGFRQNPFKYMAAADLFVLSSHYEGFGNVIVEAMACGVPVVATDCPYGPREIINDDEDGILVRPGSADALAAGILRVLTDEGLKRRLSAKGRARSCDFDANGIAMAYGELFLKVASGADAFKAARGEGAVAE